MAEFIGKTISLVSQSDIRYVGILENIDGSKGTISLKDVRAFGTEGRVLDPQRIVLPNPEVFAHIMLSGPDVKTLDILEGTPEQIVPDPIPLPQMPPLFNPGFPQQQQFVPPLQQQVPPKTEATTKEEEHVSTPAEQPVTTTESVKEVESSTALAQETREAATETKETPAIESSPSAPQQAPNFQNQHQQHQHQQHQHRHYSNNGNLSNNRRERAKPKHMTDYKSEFDFASNNAQFQKQEDENEEKASNTPTSDEPAIFYNKKTSFFDTISSSTEESANDRMRWAEEKSLNIDTFGQTSLRRGGFRGRGRGGRGYRGRGGYNRGRGGYNRGGRGNHNNNTSTTPEWA